MICNMCPRHETCPDAKNGCEKCDIGQAFKVERRQFIRLKRDFSVLKKSTSAVHTISGVFFDPDYEGEFDPSTCLWDLTNSKLFAVWFEITCFDAEDKIIYNLESDFLKESRFYIRTTDIFEAFDYYLPTIILEHYEGIMPSSERTEILIKGIMEVGNAKETK